MDGEMVKDCGLEDQVLYTDSGRLIRGYERENEE